MSTPPLSWNAVRSSIPNRRAIFWSAGMLAAISLFVIAFRCSALPGASQQPSAIGEPVRQPTADVGVSVHVDDASSPRQAAPPAQPTDEEASPRSSLHSLSGRVVTRGNQPVPDMRIALSRYGVLPGRDPTDATTSPSSADPEDPRLAISDANGLFRIDALQPGTWRIEAWHSSMVVAAMDGASNDSIAIPSPPIVITADIVYRAAFRVHGAHLSTVNVSYPSWTSHGSLNNRSLQQFFRLNSCSNHWNSSGGEYYMLAGSVAPPPNALARCMLFFADADPVLVDVPILPVAHAHVQDVYVTRNGVGPANVKISVRDIDQKDTTGIAIGLTRIHRLGKDEVAESYSVMHGDSLRIAPGSYDVHGPSAMLSRILKSRKISVAAENNDLVIEFTQPLTHVRFSCADFAGGECDVIVWGESQADRASLRVRDGAEPVLWIPPGRYTVSVDRVGKQPRKQAFEVVPGEQSAAVALPPLSPKR